MMRTRVLCCLIMCCFINQGFNKEVPRTAGNNVQYKDVHIDTGVVRGYEAEDGEYFAFLGIPYAAPPTGINRFKAPLPAASWNDTFEATRSVMCSQDGMGEEDCLVVNVFTPTNTTGSPLPVLVYFHGGSFIMGQGYTSGFSPLMKKDIIAITVNYRLGALGFLCLGIEKAPGNAGLKDQAAALKWVQRNVGRFGGDPQEVTIYGMSAGASSVQFLIFSNQTNGLFQRAILESGTALSVFATDVDPIDNAVGVASALGFANSNNANQLVSHYQSVSSDRLSAAAFEYYTNLTNGNFVFAPCVERRIKGVDPFITQAPYDILRKGEFKRVPMLFSYAAAEGLFLASEEFYKLNYKDRMNADFSNFLPIDLRFDTEELKNQVAENIRMFYFGNSTVSEDTLMEYLNFLGDHFILYPTLKSVEIHAQRSDEPVYLLEFAYKGNMGNNDPFYESIKLAGHGDIVKHAVLKYPVATLEDEIAVERVSTVIANFAKFGNPLPSRCSLLDITWPRVKSNNVTYLYIDKNLQILDDPYADRTKFWDEIYRSYRRPITAVNPYKQKYENKK